MSQLPTAEDVREVVLSGISVYETADFETVENLLLGVAAVLQTQDGYDTAVIEVCFGAIERSIEAYALAMTGDESMTSRTTSSVSLDFRR